MIKRIVEISSARTRLSIKYGQLIIKEDNKQVASVPCEDIGVLRVFSAGLKKIRIFRSCDRPESK